MKSETVENRVGIVETPSKAAISQPVLSRIITINPVARKSELESKKTEQDGKNFVAASASLEPLVDKIAAIFDGAASKFVEFSAKPLVPDEKDAARFGEMVRMSPESRAAIRTAGARIIARRVKNDEILDWAMLAAAAGEWGLGFIACARELMAMRREMEKKVMPMNQPKP